MNAVATTVITNVTVVTADEAFDGTVVFAHAGLSSGRGIGRLNLEHPQTRMSPEGDRWNHTLRNPRAGDPPGTVYTSGALFAGYARVDPNIDWYTTESM